MRDGSAVKSTQWRDLVDELNRWEANGRIATLWWRDDDAVSPSRQLDSLLSAAGDTPIALAVIPALAQSTLASWLERCAPISLRVLQHGWRHANHGASGKKSEFPNTRSRDMATADLSAGRERLRTLFGPRALAVLAPPWNRIDESFLPLLAANGIAAISGIKPRRAVFPVRGVFAANTHVDLVAWSGDRGFVGPAAALGGVVGHLRARRCGDVDAGEPTGILTHHLVQDEAGRAFLGQLVALTRDHPAARWLAAEEVFAPALRSSAAWGRA